MKKVIPIVFASLLFVSCMKTIDVYTITAVSNDSKMGTVSGGGVYMDGNTATLTAIPNAGYIFDHWRCPYSSYGSYSSTKNPLNVPVSEDAFYTAHFKSNASVKMIANGSTYNCSYFDSHINSSLKRMVFEGAPSANKYPRATLQYDFDEEIATGVFLGHSETELGASQNPCVYYYSDNDYYVGAGWGNDITLTVTKIDLITKLISFVADAKIIQIVNYSYGSANDTTSFQLTITATDIPLGIQ